MKLNESQTEKLRELSVSCGKDLLEFFNLMVAEISDIRTDLEVEPNIDKDVRLAVINSLTEFTDNIRRFSEPKSEKGEDRFD